MSTSKSKKELSPPSSQIGLGVVMNWLLESRGLARGIRDRAAEGIADGVAPAEMHEAQEIMNRLTPIIIRLAALGQIENFELTDEERAEVMEAGQLIESAQEVA